MWMDVVALKISVIIIISPRYYWLLVLFEKKVACARYLSFETDYY